MNVSASPKQANTREDTAKPMGSLTVLPTTDFGEDSNHLLVLRRQLRLAAYHAVWIICNKPVRMYIAYVPDQESAIWKPKHTTAINNSHPFQISSQKQ
jgi:hypothetical protein